MNGKEQGDRRVQRERLYLILVISIPLVLMVGYFAYVAVLRDLLATCPPSCREQVMAGRDLRGGNWRDLPAAHLAWANLAGVDFTAVNLAGADLHEADLSGANLAGADLRGANLANATLDGANLAEAKLENAQLEGASLEGATLPK